jgi:hypothetical protein
MKKDEMYGVCRAQWDIRNAYKILLGKLKVRDWETNMYVGI